MPAHAIRGTSVLGSALGQLTWSRTNGTSTQGRRPAPPPRLPAPPARHPRATQRATSRSAPATSTRHPRRRAARPGPGSCSPSGPRRTSLTSASSWRRADPVGAEPVAGAGRDGGRQPVLDPGRPARGQRPGLGHAEQGAHAGDVRHPGERVNIAIAGWFACVCYLALNWAAASLAAFSLAASLGAPPGAAAKVTIIVAMPAVTLAIRVCGHATIVRLYLPFTVVLTVVFAVLAGYALAVL